MSKMKKNQKDGFSLIELVIAIAVLAIFVGMISLSTALLRSADTKGLASGINDALTNLKSLTESHQGPYYLHIYKTENGFYANYSDKVDMDSSDNSEKLGSSVLNVKYFDGATEVDIEDDVYSTVKIQKKDGAYQIAPVEFRVYNADKLEYKVYLIRDTGLHYMELQ